MTEQLPLSEMEIILLTDDRVLSIIHDGPWQPREINFDLWEPNLRQEQRNRVDRWMEYLAGPYLEERFGNAPDADQQRGVWRGDMESKYTWFRDYYSKNPLRAVALETLKISVKNLREGYIGPESDRFGTLCTGINTIINTVFKAGYKALPFAEKVKYVKEIKQKLYDVITFLSLQQPVPQS